MELSKLMALEEQIENSFITLANLEVSGKRETFDYEEQLCFLNSLVDKEKKLLKELTYEEVVNLRRQVLNNCNKKESPLTLGHLTNASYFRVLHNFNFLLGSESFDYETYLRYDLNQIILAFLENLIANEYYEDIKNDLIFYKYNLIFMNLLSEYDFLKTEDISGISIESKNFKTDENLYLEFVDKSLLILEGKEYIDSLRKLLGDFKDNNNDYALAIIATIEVLARLILCDNDILNYLQQDFNLLLEDENISLEVKNIVQEMLIILEQLKNRISLAR